MRKIDDRTLTKAQKEKVLDKYDRVCVYCYSEADVVDHIIPWSYSQDDHEDNLVASCWLCNLIASNKVFDTFSIKQAHIQDRRYSWIKKNPISLWLVEELEEFGYAMRESISSTCLILDNEEERQKVKRVLMAQGFRIFT